MSPGDRGGIANQAIKYSSSSSPSQPTAGAGLEVRQGRSTTPAAAAEASSARMLLLLLRLP